MTEEIHDHTLAKWKCGCDPVFIGLLEAAKRTGNIDIVIIDLNEQDEREAER